MTATETGIRLNLGAGSTRIDGFTPIDRKLGSEVYPLKDYADESVEEIRASHILEHFDFEEVPKVLREWCRVLKQGARIRIAVPDAAKVVSMQDDPKWPKYLMGGQSDPTNYHKSAFSENTLREAMESAGLRNITRWESPNTDSASYPFSLNLEGVKLDKPEDPTAEDLKICAVMSVPRVGWTDAYVAIHKALRPYGIPVTSVQGAFWGQCIERGMDDAIAKGVDWILTIDYDSLFSIEHLDSLISTFGKRPDIDALAAMQCRRGKPFPIFVSEESCTNGECKINMGEPYKVITAHFGLTLLRTEAIKKLPKPWFHAKDIGDGEPLMDDDIYFWHLWKAAGNSVYVAPDVRIGHLELMVADFDENLQQRHSYVPKWREENKI